MPLLALSGKSSTTWNAEPFVARVVGSPAADSDRAPVLSVPIDGGPVVCRGAVAGERLMSLPIALDHVSEGDVISVTPTTGHLSVLYRRASACNTLLLTEQCNSRCVMCSQPPRRGDDTARARAVLSSIPLVDPSCGALGITGGEPTLMPDLLLDLLRACCDRLPNTAVHLLSNGRKFSYLTLCTAVAEIAHPDFVIGIPLYSHSAQAHDRIVQVEGAFDQTVRGILSLKRVGVQVEIRNVVIQENVDSLAEYAHFVARNLPFADHVALMGLERIGFGKANYERLEPDPDVARRSLAEAVGYLDCHGVPVSIYNFPHCELDTATWPFARQSISDWKNEYAEDCDSCAARARCCGFFSWNLAGRCRPVRPISHLEASRAALMAERENGGEAWRGHS